jgi:hypothetical protein
VSSNGGVLAPEAVRFQNIEHTSDELRQLAKRWDNRLILKGLSLAEQYVNGRIAIALVMEQSFRPLSRRSWLADNRPISLGMAGDHEDPSCRYNWRIVFLILADRDLKMGFSRNGWDKESMLIHAVKIVKGKEASISPSFVRFYDISDYKREIGHGALYKSVVRGTYEVLPRIAHREVNKGRIFFLPRDNDSGSKQIKGCAEIMDSVTDDQRDFVIKPRLPTYKDLMMFAAGNDILVGESGADFRVNEITEPNLQFVDMLVGPFDL